MATLEIDGVRKTYPGGVEAVKGVSFGVPDGAFAVLVGPSGCGKSTLLRMIAGLETITAGNIRIAGKVVNEVEPADRDIAMVFQNYALYPHMSVYDNMAYGLRNRGTPADEIRIRVDEAAKLLEIDQLLKRRPRELSGGQRQRVAMGRAIVRKPAAFLFDEPLSNLDAKLRVQMRVEIKKLQQRLGTTSVYVTHDQVEAMTMADLLVVMNGGVADQIGPPREIYQRPATLFVAAFIGSPAMNLMPGIISADGASVAVADVSLPIAGRHAPGRKVMVGLRPEDLIAADDGPVRLEIELVEHLGTDTIVHGSQTSASQHGKPVVARLAGDRDIDRGTTLRFTILPGRVHLFDAETGRRL